jgi:hypothetical protein
LDTCPPRLSAGFSKRHPGEASNAYLLHNEDQIYHFPFSRSRRRDVRRLRRYHRDNDHDADSRAELDVRAVTGDRVMARSGDLKSPK